ncbi:MULTISPECIES: hypothetical protein [Paenibacillus]|uniref:hypothetical protein n=1 Tax=Paenibacillus TaxID=44249 RepID=UPI0022B8792B|nr:hypothetical protein [Paenibacillus caseinilyticus]MCZ8517864.1 hypothetical protein [Paenibacillus caseinilyticus]
MEQFNSKQVKSENQEISSFNSVTEHYRTIVGTPTSKVDMGVMPWALRIFGYTVFSIGAICSVTFIIMYVLQSF